MQVKEFLNEVCEKIKYKPIRKEIAEELQNHINETKENYIEEGIKEKEAEQLAIKQMGEAKNLGKKLNKIHKPKFNLMLFILTIILLQFSFLISYVSSNKDNSKINLILIILGLIPCMLIYFFDYRKLSKYSKYLYIIATIVLILADGRNYIVLGKYYIFPNIIFIPLYIIAFIGFISNINKNNKINLNLFNKEIIINKLYLVIFLSVVSILLLIARSKVSFSIILTIVYLVLTTIKILQKKENRRKNITILGGSVIGMLSFILIIFLVSTIINGQGIFRMNRLVASFSPELDPNGSGWQALEQKKVMDNVNWFGKVENIEQNTMLLFNAESSVFPLIAIMGNFGLAITILMVAIVIAFNIKLILDARKIKDNYGKMLIFGISSYFIIRSIACILMNLNLGIRVSFYIPFVYSAKIDLIVDMICLALVFSIYRKKNIQNIMIQSTTI